MINISNLILYSPAISSLNMGDHIIVDAAKKQLANLTNNNFIVEISTHLPISKYIKYVGSYDYCFVCGSNLLRGKMNRRFRQWDISLFPNRHITDCILIGAGWWQYGDEPNYYTEQLYKKVLSSEYIHSVRDSYTEKQLIKMGISNVLNTSCPTMWDLTTSHCRSIPQKKAASVIFTLTDYNRDGFRDNQFVDILLKSYNKVYFWVQGKNDFGYFSHLCGDKKGINVLPPSISAYDEILSEDVDYVGTRLHAGIRALQKKKRSIIIAVDNRAREKQRDFNIKCIERAHIDRLDEIINGSFATEITIPTENINKWKSQFVAGAQGEKNE